MDESAAELDLLIEIEREVSSLVEDEEDATSFTFSMAGRVKNGMSKAEAFAQTWKETYGSGPEDNPWMDDDEEAS